MWLMGSDSHANGVSFDALFSGTTENPKKCFAAIFCVSRVAEVEQELQVTDSFLPPWRHMVT